MNILSLKPPTLSDVNRVDLIQYFKNTWDLYELLFSSIISEDTFYLRPDPLRHPLIFYYGHTAVFYVNKLKKSCLINKGINDHFEEIFAKGVDPTKSEELNLNPVQFPSLEKVKNYRAQVYKLVNDLLQSIPLPNSIHIDDPLWSIYMALEHERIHFETSSVLIRQLPTDLLSKPKGWKYAPDTFTETGFFTEPKMLQIPSSIVKLGKMYPEYYGWDNEYGSKSIEVSSFYTSQTLINNYQFRKFVQDGGYTKHRYWSKAGWKWRTQHRVTCPKFWHLLSNGCYEYRAMFDCISMPLSWPAEVNYYEAEAYCNWLGSHMRVMREAEYRSLEQNHIPQKKLLDEQCCNINIAYGSPTPVNYYMTDSDSPCDILGNVWQWISDDFYPLPGFTPHPYYLDFSTPYFGKDHVMMLGGSWASTGTSAIPDYRLWFRKHFFQHAGFRVCASEAAT